MPAVNPGTTNLAAWWSLNETSGTRNDSHGTNHLTVGGSTSYAAGLVGNAVDLEAATLDYLSVADNASMSMGGTDFTIAGWVRLESKPAVVQTVIARYSNATAAQREYIVRYATGADRFQFYIVTYTGGVPGVGTTLSLAQADTFGAVSTATWYFVACKYVLASRINYISINGGAWNASAAHAVGQSMADTATLTAVGAYSDPLFHWDGLLDELCVYRRAVTDDEITWLYNGGAGRAYSALAGGAPTMMQHHHAMLANRR